MRLIDADALDTLLKDAQTECKRNGGNFRFGVLNTIRENIAKMPTVGGWTSVKDHPPEKDEDVIIYGKYIGSSGSVYPVMLITDISEFVISGYVPIAWMPRPEPPKEEE